MAYMYPATNTADSRGEQFMYDKFAELLPSGFVCYHNRVVGLLQFDFAVLVPGRGILICEVKGHRAGDIKGVQGNAYILNDGAAVYSPYEQALKYRRIFFAYIRDQMQKDIPVFAVACYPFITEAEYMEKGLDKLSSREETLLADDINHALTTKILDLLTAGRARTGKQFSELTLHLMLKIRSVFEPADIIAKSMGPAQNKPQFVKRRHYSCVAVLPSAQIEAQKTEVVATLIETWRAGTKLCIITDDEALLDSLRIDIDNFLLMLDGASYERFTLFDSAGWGKAGTFNLELYCMPGANLEYAMAYDGVFSPATTALLTQLNAETDFNLNQYLLEHGEINRHIMVLAGAGTGKTTSMISRISYLVYKHQFTAETLPDALFMLTFTNEAARNMKQKLKAYFQDYFLLTMDYEALKLSEMVEGMRIGTIHALSKRILEHYAVHLGLGKSLQIVSGKREKDGFLTEAINTFIQKEPQAGAAMGLPMYELHSRLLDVMTKLQSKNIDINHDALDWGQCSDHPLLHQMITQIPGAVERETREHLGSFSKIQLSDLMIKMKELVRLHGAGLQAQGFPVQYVFIDEFQDTDDVQIDLVKTFQAVYGFALFVVGDVKQCIYRFRGANDKAFDVLVPSSQKADWLTFELYKNYRTDKHLLEALDTRFSRWGKHKLLEYRHGDRLLGVRTFHAPTPQNAYYYCENRWRSPEERDRRLVNILQRLQRDLAGSKEQIAVLVRENWQVEAIKTLCAAANINVETDVGGQLYQLQPVIDLYKLVKALQHYKTPKHLFNLYTTYFITDPMPKEAIFQSRFSGGAVAGAQQTTHHLCGLFNTALSPIPKWTQYVAALKHEPALKVLREIVLDLKPWHNRAHMEITQGEQKRAGAYYRHNLDAIFEKLAFAFNSDYLTIGRIERFLETMILTGQKEPSREPFGADRQGKIVCMTVHKAKGLEYHTVILPYMATAIGRKNHKGNTDIIVHGGRIGYSIKTENKTIANSHYQAFKTAEALDRRDEEARILYVAMTRAKNRFIYFDDMKDAGTMDRPKDWRMLLRGEGGL
ncbi:MAG: UvrD-helicase domain-containing protein [Defluviitaleaceae bacterium]|nr:UvrD-helicase domain-containing protein [Defluviitaleaceae bacterium]